MTSKIGAKLMMIMASLRSPSLSWSAPTSAGPVATPNVPSVIMKDNATVDSRGLMPGR